VCRDGKIGRDPKTGPNRQNRLKTGAKFKSFEILNLISKPDRIPVYRPILLINRTGFEENRHGQFLGLQRIIFFGKSQKNHTWFIQ
jgi:hypothetical protein